MTNLAYIDGNCVSYLWDKYTSYKIEGQTGDDIALSPFSDAAISEYVLDELLTIPIDSAGNAYKKHLALLSVYPQIPVFRSITIFSKAELEKTMGNELLHPSKFAGQVAFKRTLALVMPEHRRDLESDIKHKLEAIEAAKMFLTRDSMDNIVYTQPENRITIKETIEKIVGEQKLNPQESTHDFYILCMNLYVATRNRLIKVPGMKIYKGANGLLNSQIDFYHLSYLPFVNGFVTNDKYLSVLAHELDDYLNLGKAIYTGEEYWNLWLRKLLSST